MKIKILIFLIEIIILRADICPNNCSGHICCNSSVCECLGEDVTNEKSSSDCDGCIYKCENGNSFPINSSKSKHNSLSIIKKFSEVNIRIERKVMNTEDGILYRVTNIFELSKYLPKSGGVLNVLLLVKDLSQ